MRFRPLDLILAPALCLCLLLFSQPSQAVAVCPGVSATCLSGQGDWADTLEARSLDGGATIGAYYDSALNITWLADANYANTSGFTSGLTPSNGTLSFTTANAWANSLDINGFTGWRLPTMTDVGGNGCDFSNAGGTDCGYNVLVSSELAHMFYVTLGDKSKCTPGDGGCFPNQPGAGLTNAGPFANLQADFYWTNLPYAPEPTNFAWNFDFSNGNQFRDSQTDKDDNFAWAVIDGSVGVSFTSPPPDPVPLPASAWLLLSGLLGMLMLSRRSRHVRIM